MIGLKDLRALADAATPGPWAYRPGYGAVASIDQAAVARDVERHGQDHVDAYGGALVGESMSPPDREYVAACDPPTILKLVDELLTARTTDATCPICSHEWRRHDPQDGCCDSHDAEILSVCRCGRDMAWMNTRTAALSQRALEAS